MNNLDRYDETLEQKEINLLDYWMIIWKRKWLVLAITLAIFAVFTFRTYLTTPIYTAKGTLLIEREEPNVLALEQIFQITPYWNEDFYQTQYKLLQSRALAAEVVKRLKLEENALAGAKEKRNAQPADSLLRRSLINSVQARVRISPVKQTRLVEVSFNDPNPNFAANVVNAVFDSFINMNIETKFAATEQATEFLTMQIASLTAEIESKEKEFQAYGVEKNIIALSDTETTIIEKLGELNRAYTEAQIDRVKKEAYYNEIKGVSLDYMPETLNNPLIQKLREEYVKLSRDYTKKQETFKPDYPEMQRLKKELETAKSSLESETLNLIKAAYSDYQAALKRERSLEAVFNRQKQEAIQLNSNAISYNSLKIELDNKKGLLESLMKRQSEAGVTARLRGLRTSNIKVVDRAEVPLSPSGPNKRRNMMLGFIFGLIGGLGLAFLLHYLDNSVKSSEDVEKYAGLPTLGIVPAFSVDGFGKGYGYGYGYGHRKKHKTGIPLDKSTTATSSDSSISKGRSLEKFSSIKAIELMPHFYPKSNFSESYRSIRTALLLSSADPNLKTFVITSSLPSEGKTATVCNLGVTLAQANKKVLLVDSDLRKPKLHRIFKIKNLNGLTNYLTTNINLKDLINVTQVPNLYLINAGPIPPNPAELLGSEKMENLINTIRQTFDYILFDSPPILPVADAMVIGPKTNGVILVISGGKTSREALRRAKEKLDLTKIKTLGVILNRVNLQEYTYYYKYHYYHYYGEE